MKFSIELPPKDPLWRLKIYSNIIENLGFNSIWTSEHYYNRSSVISGIAIGQATQRLKICMGIFNPYLTHPITIAQIAATLTEMYPNRICVGIGAGDRIALDNLGIQQYVPLKKVDEAINVVRKILEGRRINEYVRLDFKAWGYVPIYVAAQRQKMLKLAAKVADGVLINYTGFDNMLKSISIVRESLREFSRTDSQFNVEVNVMISISEDRIKALKTIMPYVSILALGIERDILEQYINEKKIEQLKYYTSVGNWQEVQGIIPEELLNLLSVSGTPNEVYPRIAELCSMHIDGIVFGGPLGPNPRKALWYIKEIVSQHIV